MFLTLLLGSYVYSSQKYPGTVALLAAAPEMYKALEDGIEQITALCSADDVPDSAKATIRKAKGEL